MIAHIGGLPIEELLLPLMSVGSGIALVILRVAHRGVGTVQERTDLGDRKQAAM